MLGPRIGWLLGCAGSPSSRTSALSRTSASSPLVSLLTGFSLACGSSAICHWSGLTICGCGVALWMKSMLASLMAVCARDGGSAASPMPAWIGEGHGSNVLPPSLYCPQYSQMFEGFWQSAIMVEIDCSLEILLQPA